MKKMSKLSAAQKINATLTRATGLQIVRVRHTSTGQDVHTSERLLQAPVFVLSSIRSGSTLLRVILGSHSHLYAPHELHLGSMSVKLKNWFAKNAMAELGFDETELTDMLWDRMLAEALRASGKQTLVEKTPAHVFMHRRLARVWPDARFLFLLRHPGSIYQSWQAAHPDRDSSEAVAEILKYVTEVERARTDLNGHDVRYEDLAAQPEHETRRICQYLGIPWESTMLEYGEQGHTEFRRGLGDWSGKIRSGKPQPPRPAPRPDEVPEELHAICQAWGYFSQQPVTR